MPRYQTNQAWTKSNGKRPTSLAAPRNPSAAQALCRAVCVLTATFTSVAAADVYGQPMLAETAPGMSYSIPSFDPNARIEQLERDLEQALTQEERNEIEQEIRTLRGSRDYYLRDTTVSAYPTYQMPQAEDGLVQFEVSRQISSTTETKCGACGCHCGGTCRRGIGCPHPWRTGPGWCDDWCTGPHWEVSVDGLIMRRDNLDVPFYETAFGAAASPVEQFYYQPGARAYATGRGIAGYDVQLGYVGVDTWRAYADFDLGGGVNRNLEYRTGFHSGELNIYPQFGGPWRLFTGVRYLELGEDLWIRDTPTNVESSAHVDNKLIGFQIGLRRELWQFTEWAYVESLFNGGVYNNNIRRFNRSGPLGATSVVERRTYNDIAFVGEASLTAVARLNRCVALRGGYQVLFVDGITTAQDVYFFSSARNDSLVYHGLHVGLEYRR